MVIGTTRRVGALLVAFLTGALLSLGSVRLVHERYAPTVSQATSKSDAVKPDESRHDPPESAPLKPAPDKNRPDFGLDDADILLYVEAVTRIKDEAIHLGPNITRAQIVGQSLRALLARKDLCCDYLTREEYRRFKQSLNESYVGIGMEITQDRNGRTIGLPLPESPAARAGIPRGSELRSIDGVRVDGKSLFNVAALARGKPGTEVRVAIVTRDGREREFSITRGALTLPSVSMRTVEGSPVIVLSHFTRDTKRTLMDALKNWPRDVPIIIDLRGNGGGDLHAAIDSAMLFLDEGKRVVSVQTRKGTRTYESRVAVVDRTIPVYVWQDEGTASAAEVFMAALTDNERAVSIGRGTAGKATWEEIVELSDGSALILAIGNLQTPNGVRYEGKGLKPNFELRADAVDTRNYLAKVREVSTARGVR